METIFKLYRFNTVNKKDQTIIFYCSTLIQKLFNGENFFEKYEVKYITQLDT
jgi:hypothetical protein